MDTLSLLLSRFAISAGVFYTGSICGVHAFEADRLRGHLHLIEQGPVDLIDADGGCLHIARPSIVFLPRSDHHRLVADDRKGARVICATVQFGGGSSNPICDSLPPLVLVQLAELEGTGLLLELIGQEAFRETPGGQAACCGPIAPIPTTASKTVAGASPTPPATASWPSSPARWRRCAAPSRSRPASSR